MISNGLEVEYPVIFRTLFRMEILIVHWSEINCFSLSIQKHFAISDTWNQLFFLTLYPTGNKALFRLIRSNINEEVI